MIGRGCHGRDDMESNDKGFVEGQTITFKKTHPCGCREWLVLRAGWEYRLQCVGCKRIMIMRRDKVEKAVKINTHI